MDKLLESSLVQAEVMKCNNYCRYRLEVTTVAEITTSDRTRIKPECFYRHLIQDKVDMKHRLKENTWPRHVNPSRDIWIIWHDSLQKTICDSHGTLHKPLKKWE
eukprot:11652247-Ditylum_brightwellii.AAC.1